MLPHCEHCGVAVHRAWEFCRRCGGELAGAVPWQEPRIVPDLSLERFPRAEAGLAGAARAVRRRWRPLNARLVATLEDWQRRLDS